MEKKEIATKSGESERERKREKYVAHTDKERTPADKTASGKANGKGRMAGENVCAQLTGTL